MESCTHYFISYSFFHPRDWSDTAFDQEHEDDGDSYRGEFALDPAHLIDHYFDGLGTFSQQYINNPYLQCLRAAGYTSTNVPPGFPSQLRLDSLYSKLTATCPNT